MSSDRAAHEVAKQLSAIGLALKYMGGGDNGSQMGALELVARSIERAGKAVADAQSNEGAEALAQAVARAGIEIKDGLADLASALGEVAEALKDKPDA